jgi:RNA polymerase sigma-70 factor, ECF subfamily
LNEGRREAEKISTEQYYEYLIDTYQNLIYSICYKLVKDYFDAEDLAQETFLSAYKHLPTFDRQYEKAWLCRIATNKCLDYLKRSERQSIPTEDVYFLEQRDKEPTPEDNVLEAEVKKQLSIRCNELKSPYREIALDYFYLELPPAEIASKTGKNLKTVQTQIYRAKAMLQKKYRKGAICNEG